MDHPLVSAVIAVHNGERYLAAAIESALAQDYRPMELIVLDDRSTDGTARIARSYAEVRYETHAGTGYSDALNAGVEAARGELVAFLSHDDFWTPDKLSVQATWMIENAELQYTTAMAKFFLEPGCAAPPCFRTELLLGDHAAPIPETLMVRRAFFQAVGGFDRGLEVASDADWMARAKDSGAPTAVIPRVLLHKRIHGSNMSSNAEANNRDLLRLLKASIERQRSRTAG